MRGAVGAPVQLLLVTLLLAVGLSTPAEAQAVLCTAIQLNAGALECGGSEGGGGEDKQPPRPSNPNAPYYEYRYLPMCSGNNIVNSGDVMCNGAATYCTATGQEGIAFWVWRRLIRTAMPAGQQEGAWQRLHGVQCRGGNDPGVPTTAQAADYVRREFQRLVVVSGRTRIDPGNKSLVNVDTIFSTDKIEPEALPAVSILGHTVVITVKPEQYSWHFGDGSPPLITSIPGRPLTKDVTHVFRSAGRYDAKVTISWSGTFTIDGGESLTITGRASTTGAATSLQVGTARSELVRR